MSTTIWNWNLREGVSSALDRINGSMQRTFAKVAVIEREVADASQKAAASINNTNGALSRLKTTALGFTAGLSFVALGGQILGIGSNMEQTNIAFEVLLQNADLAKVKIGELQKFADVSPFNTREVFEAGQSLLGFGVDAKALIPIMNMLGDASTGNSNKFKGLVDNYGKLVSAQRANTMDLNQFAIAGVPIWKELEKITGKTGIALRKWVEQNGVSVPMVNQALQNLTSQGGQFFGMMQKQATSTQGIWSTFMSHLESIAVRVFNKLQPTINELILLADNVLPVVVHALGIVANAFGNVLHWVNQHWELLKALGVVLLSVAAAWAINRAIMFMTTGIMSGLTLVEKGHMALMILQEAVTNNATLAQLRLNMALIANPIGLVVIAIGVAVAAITYLWNKSEGFRKFLFSLWETVKTVFKGIASAIWDNLKGSAKLMVGIMTLNLDMIKEGFRDIVSSGKSLAGLPTQVGDAWQKGQQKGAESWQKSQGDKNPNPLLPSWAGGAAAAANKGKGGLPGLESGGAAGSGSGGGGSSVRNVTVRIDNLIRNLTINATSIADLKGQMQEVVKETIVGAVRDSEMALS